MNVACQKQTLSSLLEISDRVHPFEQSGALSPQIVISEKEYLTLKCEVGYWRSMHKKALSKIEKLNRKIAHQKGEIRDLKNRIFGKKSEKKNAGKKDGDPKKKGSGEKRNRGQQTGTEGHGRTKRPNLPRIEEPVNFPEGPTCSKCGTAYIFDEYKESEIIEVEVKAHTRVIQRSCMKKDCTCKGVPGTVTAPMPPKVLPKSPYGISIWENVLLSKFRYCQPTNRLLGQFAEMGLPISAGTIAGGLQRLRELFKPVYDALHDQQMTEDRFHNDESSWKVFESVDGKIGNRWWLWVSRSATVVFFKIAPGRGANVVVEHFNDTEQQKIIVICDRYSAYKSLARQLTFITLAFCWAHVRRDFLEAARKYPELTEWALDWVEKIGELYHINNKRTKEFDQKLPVQGQSTAFKKGHEKLVAKTDIMAEERDASINEYSPDAPDSTMLTDVKFKVLTSVKKHWHGLTVFVEHPEVPMDNNNGEQSIRNPVTGRKNFYGSGSLWSSELAAMMFSIFQTLVLCGLNCHHWLRLYLTACAENNGKPPEDLSPFLPWKMDKERRQQLAKPYNTS
jgi:transposase